MANALRGQTSFQASSQTWQVAFDWNAAAEYEQAAGRPLSAALQDLVAGRLSATSMRAMLWAGLQRHHAREVSITRAGEFLDELGRVEAHRLMGVALRYFFPEIREEAPPDPPSPAAP
jgi:hypothetical protein